MRWRLGLLGLAAWAVIATAPHAAPDPARTAAEAMAQTYVAAWDRRDAQALGAQFAPDGDFINPAGAYVRGPEAVAAFYRSVFTGGYGDSHGAFRVVKARQLAPGVIAIDGEFTIDRPGHPREAGLASAILVHGKAGWKLATLREQEGASAISGG